MKHLNNNKKKNKYIVTAATLFTAATIIVFAGVSAATLMIGINQSAEASTVTFDLKQEQKMRTRPAAPAVVSGDNIYIAWWTNNTENNNEEVMFRASTDGGATFSDKINLSNTTDADSWRVELHGEGDTVVVSWWETNQTSDIPVARISTDAGETFGTMLRLGANGTISSAGEEGEGGEGEVEVAVGGAAAGEEGGG